MPDAGQIQAQSEAFCHELGLDEPAAFNAWLAAAGLTIESFGLAMADFAAVLAVERQQADALADRLRIHQRLSAARERHLNDLKPDE
ncbi:MAG: hypothetical protein KDK91_33290 [Gammaproteobacteria bacterium]|nr:hypothetical protein [Gammaproteobacteria bacterium]